MKDSHTFTITIPTKLILYVLLGVLIGATIGLTLTWMDAAGIELVTPLCGVPLLDTRPAEKAVPAVPVPAETLKFRPADTTPFEHPAVVAYRAVPTHIRQSFDAMVDRVLIEKKARAA